MQEAGAYHLLFNTWFFNIPFQCFDKCSAVKHEDCCWEPECSLQDIHKPAWCETLFVFTQYYSRNSFAEKYKWRQWRYVLLEEYSEDRHAEPFRCSSSLPKYKFGQLIFLAVLGSLLLCLVCLPLSLSR